MVKHAVCFRASVALVLPIKYLNYSMFAYLKAHMTVSQSLFIRLTYDSRIDQMQNRQWTHLN